MFSGGYISGTIVENGLKERIGNETLTRYITIKLI